MSPNSRQSIIQLDELTIHLIASGEASVEIIKKNINRKNRMSARAPVSTSDASLALFLKFIELRFRSWLVKNI